jgi:cytochrome c553
MASRISATVMRAVTTIAAVAAVFQAGHAQASGDAALGAKKFYTCYGCHGIREYKNAYPNYSVPKLRGQHAAYIAAAIIEYKQSERPHATMHAQAVSLSPEDIDDIAAFLQGGSPIKPNEAVVGTPPAAVATCAACHGQNGLGVDAPLEPKPPVLAGQHADYLQEALKAYRSGRRKNPIMAGMAQSLKDEDITALASYFEQQASPLDTAVRR